MLGFNFQSIYKGLVPGSLTYSIANYRNLGVLLLFLAATLLRVDAQRSSSRNRPSRASVAEQLWAAMISDDSDRLKLDVAKLRAKEWFRTLDHGQAGSVSQSEFLQQFAGIIQGRAVSRSSRSGASLNRFLGLFLFLDSNGDRSLSDEEWQSGFDAVFQAAAGDSDGMGQGAFTNAFEQRLPKTNLTGMRKGESPSRERKIPVPPPSPVLSPKESMASIKLASGFELRLAAEEPLIEDPVAFSFDPAGRLYVVEMRSFMLDIDGTKGRAPISRISLLEDSNHDGRFDRVSRFLEDLVEPRALLATHGGLLYVADYQLFFAEDLDGDGRADSNRLVDPDYGRGNVEHAPNGLMLGMDNWIYNAKSRFRYRWVGDDLLRQETEFRGQWGMSQDNQGRLFYNINNSQLLGDFSPPNYMGRNPNHSTQAGLNLYVLTDQRVFPIRMNTAVNRGYLPDVLDERGRLYVFASSCSPVIYRGHTYGEDFVGNAFVCDPAANLVKRNLVFDHDLELTSRFAYPAREFLASTDERFRPVGLSNAPDGNLWLLDMYRGISQYGLFMTPYLREESLKRELQKGIHLGRIYKLVRPPNEGTRAPDLSGLQSETLVPLLAHPNGWVRDTAQALLVERRDPESIHALIPMALAETTSSWGRLHALWTLEGLSMTYPGTALQSSQNPSPRLHELNPNERELSAQPGPLFDRVFATCLKLATNHSEAVQMAAIRVGEHLARTHPDRQHVLLAHLLENIDTLSQGGAFQAALTAGELPRPTSFSLFQSVLKKHSDSSMIREAVLSGLGGWELAFLQVLWSDPDWEQPAPGKRSLFHSLAAAILVNGKPTEFEILFSQWGESSEQTSWKRESLLTGISQGLRSRGEKRVAFNESPRFLELLSRAKSKKVAALKEEILAHLAWPGFHWEPESENAKPTELNEKQSQGRDLFVGVCAGCHGMEGEGVRPVAPPLQGSEWVEGAPERLVQIILHGMQGPLSVAGKTYQTPDILPEMPPLAVLEDDQIAAIVSFLRIGLESDSAPVNQDMVARERRRSAARVAPWRAAELEETP